MKHIAAAMLSNVMIRTFLKKFQWLANMTLALGAVTPPPTFNSQVNLKTQYGFGTGRPDHSGQFQRDIQFMYGNEVGAPWRDSDGSEQSLYLRMMRDLRVQP